VRFASEVLFEIDSAILSGQARATLDEVAVVLNDFPKTAVVVQGFTDSTGSEEHNLALSERRATAVMRFLVDRGIEPARMTALGYGEDHPIASNETAEGRSRNRRVSILLKGKAR
jgi:outer membrane protein OmpA-like peptidoglycan-associated protein